MPLYDLALAEKDAGLAVLATQVVLSLRSAPADPHQDARIERAVTDRNPDHLDESAWEYLETAGTRRQRLHVLAMLSRRDGSPGQARGFLENCMGHCDPDVRTAACRPAVATGNGRLLAWVLAALADPDAGVGREAVAAIRDAPRTLMTAALEEALADTDEWVPACVAEFLPLLADEGMRETLVRGTESAFPRVAARSREALARLDARKMALQLPPPPPPLSKPKDRPVEVKFSLPSQNPFATTSVAAAPPPGPLPWAHLVTMPGYAPPADGVSGNSRQTEPIADALRSPSVTGEKPLKRPGVPLPEKTAPASASEAVPSVPLGPGESAKKDRVISMRSKIAKGILEKSDVIAEKPVPLTTARPPGEDFSSGEIPANTSELVDSDVWEAVSIDFAAPREPRMAVRIEQAEPAVFDEMVTDISVDDAHLEQTVPLGRASETVLQHLDGMLSLAKPPMIDMILGRYPSFVTGPLERFFRPAGPAALMESLRAAIEPLIAFLSFTFLQTYLFFGRRTPKGDQAARDALNAHFSGPASVRMLHHLSLSVREVAGDAFFSTGLAKAMNEASEDMNPLFMLREVTEFLKTPPNLADDGLRQVAGGLPVLLAACKGILQNPIVLRLPPGAREPFLNLSGPRPCPLPPSERPGLDLPANEIVVLSKDRSEALGLFPYFVFDGRSVMFCVPSDAEFKTLLERLGLTV